MGSPLAFAEDHVNDGSSKIIVQKLSRKDASDIRRAALGGATTAEHADRYGVGVHTVRAVLRYDRFPPQPSRGTCSGSPCSRPPALHHRRRARGGAGGGASVTLRHWSVLK